jgi:uncharacterized protein YdbL (DUF1318 family)
MKKKCKFLNLGFIIFITACVTVNIYFPAAAVQKAADEIVDDVRKMENKEEQKPEQKQMNLLQEIERFVWEPSEAHAQINIEVSTPAIRALKDSIRERFPQLKPFYNKGSVGENNVGLLETRDISGLNLKEKADLSRLVDSENKDRKALYTEIIKANKLGQENLLQVQKIFANSWRDKSQSGWWIQNDKGAWEKKK